MSGRLCYVLYGRYRGQHMLYHDLRTKLLSKLNYDVTCYVIRGGNRAPPVFAGYTAVQASGKTLGECVYEGLAAVPECDFIYLSEVSSDRVFLIPSPAGSTCQGGGSRGICIPKALRERFMDFLSRKRLSLDLSAFPVPRQCRYLTFPSPRGDEGEVCLVGNGPLSPADREDIQKCKTIVRFNDTKNRITGERCDVHIMRRAPRVHTRHPDFYPVDSHDGESKVILVGRNAQDSLVLQDHVIERIQYDPPFDLADQLRGQEERLTLFEGCDTSFYGSRGLRSVSQHASLGIIATSMFQQREDVHAIHVYGMNFNFLSSHKGDSEREVMNACCRKCVVHPTVKSRYYPRNEMSVVAILIIVITMLLAVYVVPLRGL